MHAFTMALANTLFGEPVTLPTKIKPVSIDTSILNCYIGSYKTKTNNEKNHLMIAVNGQSKLEAIPLSKTQFIVEQAAAVFTFITDPEGRATAVKLDQGGLVIVGDRIN